MCVADLHIHSHLSDGLLSPLKIVEWGIHKKLRAISITDHDTVSAIDEAISYSLNKDIEVIPGIELSTEYCGVEVHMLGYYFNYNDILLKQFLDKLIEGRMERAKTMVKKLKRLGFNIEFDHICETAKFASAIGRPHIARAMVSLGYCNSIEEVFEKYIGIGKPAYVERYKISPFQAVEIILKCGGAAAIAHPGLIINIDKFLLIKKLYNWGLRGIEVYHTAHTKEDIIYLNNIAKKLDLIPTGGSDCHGIIINNEPMIGSVVVPYSNVIRLKESIYKEKN